MGARPDPGLLRAVTRSITCPAQCSWPISPLSRAYPCCQEGGLLSAFLTRERVLSPDISPPPLPVLQASLPRQVDRAAGQRKASFPPPAHWVSPAPLPSLCSQKQRTVAMPQAGRPRVPLVTSLEVDFPEEW